MGATHPGGDSTRDGAPNGAAFPALTGRSINPAATRIGLKTRTSGHPGGRHESAEPFGQLRLIGPRGGVSEPGEEDRCNTRDPAKPHRDHQSSPRRGHGDGPPEHGARQLQDGDRGKDDRHDQGVTLRVHDLLALNSSVPGVRNW